MKRFAVVLVLVSACNVDPIDLGDRACDDEHPCVRGYVCVDEICVREDEPDAGPATEAQALSLAETEG